MWEFITNNIRVIILVAFVSAIIIYIFLKQDSSKKKILLKQQKSKEENKKPPEKEEKTQNVVKEENISEPLKVIQKEEIQKQPILQNNEKPRGDRQESLDNFKNERLKTHILKLKPEIQAIVLKK